MNRIEGEESVDIVMELVTPKKTIINAPAPAQRTVKSIDNQNKGRTKL